MKIRHTIFTLALASSLTIVVIAILTVGTATRVHADTYTVTNTNANGPGSLRRAIIDANTNPGHDIIDFGVSGTIVLTDVLPSITDNLTISGPGAENLAVSGANAYRVFHIDSSTAVTITGVTIRNGKASGSNGGGIYSAGHLRLVAAHIFNNSTTSSFPYAGGGVYIAYGSAVLTDTQVYSNSAYGGGGLYVYFGSAVLMNTQVYSNLAQWGGGLSLHWSSAALTDTQVYSNSANGGGGGVRLFGNSAVLNMSGGESRGNSSSPYSGNGGGILVDSGSAVLRSTRVYSNSAVAGGGVYVGTGSLNMSRGEIRDNSAHWGGGMRVYQGSVVLTGTQVYGNSADNGSAVNNLEGTITPMSALTITGNVYQGGGTFSSASHALRIEGNLILGGGLFEAPSGTLHLTGLFAHTGGIYSQTQYVGGAADIGFPKAGGVILNSSEEGDLGTTEVVIRAGVDCTGVAGETVRHCYAITPTNNSNVSATITFYYDNAVLGNHVCEGINAYRWDGTWSHILSLDPAYDSDGRLCGSSPYSARVHQVDQFGDFVLATTLLSINDATLVEGNSGTSTAVFTLTRNVDRSTSNVEYATADGTAIAGEDYTAVPSTTLNFAVGETSKAISVAINGDTGYEVGETFFVNLSNPTDTYIGDSQGQGFISNDDVSPTGPGPGGVGAFDSPSELGLWLRADTGVTASGGTVSAWDDQSYSGHQAVQPSEYYQPVYRASGLNSQPVLGFNHDYLSLGDLSGSFPTSATLFIAATITDTDIYGLYSTSSANNRYYWRYYDGTGRLAAFRSTYVYHYPTSFPTSGSHIFSLESSNINYELFHNGVSEGAKTGSYAAGTDHRISYYDLTGDIGEVIIYNTALNSARRTLVENYLSAKYDIPLSAGDVYTGDDAPYNYDLDVVGIGQESDGDNIRAHSAGLVLLESGDSLDDGEYVVVGHRVVVNSYTDSDVPSGVPSRWTRVWDLDETGDVIVTLAFDLSEGGMIGTLDAAGDYDLLYSPTSSFVWSEVIDGASSINGDQITFSDVPVQDGFYTLGVPNVVENQAPYTPTNPIPTDSTSNVPITQTLGWQSDDPDGDPVTYTVAFGTDDPPPFTATTTLTSYTPTLTEGTTYYWVITASDGLSESVGPTWVFTSAFTLLSNQTPYTPTNPIPTDSTSNVPITQTLGWQSGDPDGDPVTYTVAFGTDDPPPFTATTTLTSYTPTLTKGTTYYWIITATDGISTTTGDTWSFTTVELEYVYLPLVLRDQ